MGGEDMGGEGMGGEDVGVEGEAPPTTEEAGETSLLAAPGKRDDDHAWVKAKVKRSAFGGIDNTKTAKSKGWYEPVDSDQRKGSGPRQKNMKAQDAHELATMPKRQLRMNLPGGAVELLGLGKGIYESKETNYAIEEQMLFETSQTVIDLINELEQKDNAQT